MFFSLFVEHKLFVGMIPDGFDENRLKKLFSRFGKVIEIVILKSPDGESKHCGFVKYSNHSDAVGAINGLNRSFIKRGSAHPLVVKFADTPKPLQERQLYPIPYPTQMMPPPYPGMYSPYIPSNPFDYSNVNEPSRFESRKNSMMKRKGPDGCNLFVIRIPAHWNDQDLVMNFIPFGNILSANVFVDKATGESRCFGFVSFDNPSSARLAIQNMDGMRINGKRLTVQLKKRDAPY